VQDGGEECFVTPGASVGRSQEIRRVAERLCAFCCVATLGAATLFTALPFTVVGMLSPIFLGGMALVSLLVALLSPFLPGRQYGRGTLGVSGDGVTLRGASWPRPFRLRRADLLEGWVEAPATVWLRAHGGNGLAAILSSPEECDAVLQRLGLTAKERVLRIALPKPASRVTAGLAAAIVGLVAVIPTLFVGFAGLGVALSHGPFIAAGVALLLLLGCLVAFSLIHLLRDGEIAVGADGIALRGMFGRRFFPYKDVEDVAPYADGVAFWIRGERPLEVRTWAFDDGSDTKRLIVERVRAAMAKSRAELPEVKLDVLSIAGRTVAAWAEHLRRIPAGDGYRSAALTTSELGTLVEDAEARVEHRIGAALALASADPVEARRRVRIASGGCVDPSLAEALEEAGEGRVPQAYVERLGRGTSRS
jgi:hypothetical protein